MLLVSFVLIKLSQALIITHVMRVLDRSRFILFIVIRDTVHAEFLQLLACKEPPSDAVEAQ